MKTIKIQKRQPWTPADNRAVIDLYNTFLSWQQSGTKYQKAKHVRALATSQGRSHGSVEAKLMNVSAVRQNLLQLEIVTGYKALNNYAHDLAEIICNDYGVDYER